MNVNWINPDNMLEPGRVIPLRGEPKVVPVPSNIYAGGKMAQAKISEEHLRLAEILRPKLVQDGMFLVGLGIVGNKLVEILEN